MKNIISIIIIALYAVELTADFAAVKFEDGTILGVVITLVAAVAAYVQAYVACHIGYYAEKAEVVVNSVKDSIAAKARIIAAFSHEDAVEPQTHGKDMRGEMAFRMAWKEAYRMMRLEKKGRVDIRSRKLWAAISFMEIVDTRRFKGQGRDTKYVAFLISHSIPSYAVN